MAPCLPVPRRHSRGGFTVLATPPEPGLDCCPRLQLRLLPHLYPELGPPPWVKEKHSQGEEPACFPSLLSFLPSSLVPTPAPKLDGSSRKMSRGGAAFSLSLQHTEQAPASEPLHWLLPLPGTRSPLQTGRESTNCPAPHDGHSSLPSPAGSGRWVQGAFTLRTRIELGTYHSCVPYSCSCV